MSAPERDHAAHFIPGPNGEPIATPVGGCAECSELVASGRDHAEGELRHRSDLARDVAREWAIEGWCLEVPPSLEAALDRLAAAYLPDRPQDEPR